MRKILILFVMIFLVGCAKTDNNDNSFVIATTTSFANTGVMDYLVEQYKAETGVNIDYLAVGSGKAIELGKADEADIMILHSDVSIEDGLVKDGYTYDRVPFLENEFLIVSSSPDIWNNTFVSRGDNSGTHSRELKIWKELDKPSDYVETGQGMLDTLIITDQIEGTTLVDRGTWLANKDKVDSLNSYEIDNKYTRNVYSVNRVVTGNSEKEKLADDFANWLTSIETVQKIEQFKINEYGESLFYRYKE